MPPSTPHAALCSGVAAALGGLACVYRCAAQWRAEREAMRAARLKAFGGRVDEWLAQEYREGEGDVDQTVVEDLLRKAVEYGASEAVRTHLSKVLLAAIADDVRVICRSPPHDSHALQLIELVLLRLSRIAAMLRAEEGALLVTLGGLAREDHAAFAAWQQQARWEGWCALWWLIARYHSSWSQLKGLTVAVGCGCLQPRAVAAGAALAAFVAQQDGGAVELQAFLRLFGVATTCETASALLQQWHRALSQRSDEAPLRGIKVQCVENIARADLTFLTTVVPFDLLASLERDLRVFRQLLPQAHTVLLAASQCLTCVRLIHLPFPDVAAVVGAAGAYHLVSRVLEVLHDRLIVDCEDEDLTHMSGGPGAGASGGHDLWDILGDDFVTYRLFGREVPAALRCVEGEFKHQDVMLTNQGFGVRTLVQRDGPVAQAARKLCQYAPLLAAATAPQVFPKVLLTANVARIPEAFTLLLDLVGNCGAFSDAVSFFRKLWLPALRVRSLLRLPRRIDNGIDGVASWPPAAPRDLEFQNVWFRYAKHDGSEDSATESPTTSAAVSPECLTPADAAPAAPPVLPPAPPCRRRPWIIRGVSFKAPAGQHIGIVGPSGCGKSTLLLLISRLYDPAQGRVCLAGRGLSDYNVGWLRSVVAATGQPAAKLFNDTIFANLRLGKPDATEEEAMEALRVAAADDFVTRSLLFSRIGWQGVELSSGQEARVCLARALLAQPDILLLDEASAHLDAATEDRVRQRLAATSAARNMTIVNVSHRLSFVRHCDSILVLNQDGSVADSGTHASLQRTSEWYADACRKQCLSPTTADTLTPMHAPVSPSFPATDTDASY
eukprot:TRINITY_DN1941_c0_g8_i1.p1 TRINITY_DN1941_c0_g8~~TRINITY_DN1941_c0_g8_i1.p1  ORF type:complete len:838 (+),score=271.25 TRINITY_DN1941_c0_g8_i1:94-2607(+)